MSSAIASMTGEIMARIMAPRMRSSIDLAIHRQSRSGRSMTLKKVWPPIWLACTAPSRSANSLGQSRTSTGTTFSLFSVSTSWCSAAGGRATMTVSMP